MGARTALFAQHTALGARMVEFAGYDMPLQYSNIRDEHNAVRTAAGIFDLSHMGEVRLSGPGAHDLVQRITSNDIDRIQAGGAQYAVMCNESGGIVDDVVTYRDSDSFMVVVNASCRAKDVAWMQRHAGEDTVVEDLSDQCSLIAVQGPRAVDIVAGLSDADVRSLRPFHAMFGNVAGAAARISRTGYTGEDGFELYVLNDVAPTLWRELLEAGDDAGLLPCGLGARDTLRLEAGLRLYGQDMDDNTDPYSAGLGWTVRREKGEFVGAEALGAMIRSAQAVGKETAAATATH